MEADELKAMQAPLKQRYCARVSSRRAIWIFAARSASQRMLELDTDAPEDQRSTLIRFTERYWVVLQTLRRPPAVAVS